MNSDASREAPLTPIYSDSRHTTGDAEIALFETPQDPACGKLVPYCTVSATETVCAAVVEAPAAGVAVTVTVYGPDFTPPDPA